MKKMPTIKKIGTVAKRKPAPKAGSTGPNVISHEYSPETGQLSVTFHHGARYVYHDVPTEIANEFKSAGGSGSYLHRHVIGKFDATRLKD
jgi:hypothetical protein